MLRRNMTAAVARPFQGAHRTLPAGASMGYAQPPGVSSMSRLSAVAALSLLLSLGGCVEAPAGGCRSGTECESGICLADGTCGTAPSEDAGTTPTGDAGVDAGADGPDAGPPDSGTPDAGVPSGTCLPNGDGSITSAEVPLRAGLQGTFRTARNVTWDSAAKALPDGGSGWDLASPLAGDASEPLETLSVAGTWYASDFASATYAAKLSSSSELLGVFQLTQDALLLLGVVSPEDGLFKTNVMYSPAVKVLAFPVKLQDSWSTTATVSGTYQGVLSYYSETWESHADARGELLTPLGAFPVLRVHTTVDRLVGALYTRTRSHAFVSECFGTVATVSSNTAETEVDFTSAAEVRRLSP